MMTMMIIEYVFFFSLILFSISGSVWAGGKKKERYSYLLEKLIQHHQHILFIGPTGTGKTVYIKGILNSLDKKLWTTMMSAFSAQTNANQIQVE